MYWFWGNSTAQQMSTASLKRSMVTKGLALTPFHNIKQLTNLWHFWESIYKCWESVVRRCSKEKLQSPTINIETFSGFGVASLHNNRITGIPLTQQIWRIWRIQRIWRIWRNQQIQRIAQAIFKRFLSFIYSATKGFISSRKLSSELYLPEEWTTNKLDGKIYFQVLEVWSTLWLCILVFSVNVHHYILYIYYIYTYIYLHYLKSIKLYIV